MAVINVRRNRTPRAIAVFRVGSACVRFVVVSVRMAMYVSCWVGAIEGRWGRRAGLHRPA